MLIICQAIFFLFGQDQEVMLDPNQVLLKWLQESNLLTPNFSHRMLILRSFSCQTCQGITSMQMQGGV